MLLKNMHGGLTLFMSDGLKNHYNRSKIHRWIVTISSNNEHLCYLNGIHNRVDSPEELVLICG